MINTILSWLPLLVGIGLAIGAGVLIFNQREQLASLGAAAGQRVSRGLASRYREGVIEYANTLHLAGFRVPLERIAVMPRFIMDHAPFAPEADDAPSAYDGPLTLLPLILELPTYLAAYKLPGIPLQKLLRGPDYIALLGQPGSGRSVSLALIAILIARQTEDEQEGALVSSKRTPILVHADDLVFSSGGLAGQPDVLDPLFDAARAGLKFVAAQALPSLRNEFSEGRGAILIDGLDEIGDEQQLRVVDWLNALIATYPGNKIVVSAASEGYADLQRVGFTAVFTLPWGQREHTELARLWADAWADIRTNPLAAQPTDDVLVRVLRHVRGLSPFDMSLKLWSVFSETDPGSGQIGWYRGYFERINAHPELIEILRKLAQQEIAEERGIPFETLGAQIEALATEQELTLNPADVIYDWVGASLLLTQRADKRLTFTHNAIRALVALDGTTQGLSIEPLLRPGGHHDQTIAVLAQIADISGVIDALLAQPLDLGLTQYLRLARWAAPLGPSDAARLDIESRLRRAYLQPAAFPGSRERMMAALVHLGGRDTIQLFVQGLQHTDPTIRTISAFGLGAVGSAENAPQLDDRLKDENVVVQIAATLALAALETPNALDMLTQAFVTSNELVRRAVAEMMAADIGGQGHAVLRDAMDEPDPESRKASLYGLELVDLPWAWRIIDEAQGDDQWVVRVAATTMMERHNGEVDAPLGLDLPRPLPMPERLDWLIEWHEYAGSGDQASIDDMLDLLAGDEDEMRLAAIETLAALGIVDAVQQLYRLLGDPRAEIRDAAFRAIAVIGRATGQTLPNVV
ncbi:MAG: hypothetical protein GYB68_03795 [Chloroflexi bacterium]|nr:hypothetical protein [Chloroflexota bacterium]